MVTDRSAPHCQPEGGFLVLFLRAHVCQGSVTGERAQGKSWPHSDFLWALSSGSRNRAGRRDAEDRGPNLPGWGWWGLLGAVELNP